MLHCSNEENAKVVEPSKDHASHKDSQNVSESQ